MNDNEVKRKKAEFFKGKNLAVHIVKKNNWFLNGKIISIESDFMIILEDQEGEMPVFFEEIFEIEKREEKR